MNLDNLSDYDLRNILVKSIRLKECLNEFHSNINRAQIKRKFCSVWGEEMGVHLLENYTNAETLIFNFDSKNLEIYLDKF